MKKRPTSAVGYKRPISQYARVAMAMGSHPRYRVRSWKYKGWVGACNCCFLYLPHHPCYSHYLPECPEDAGHQDQCSPLASYSHRRLRTSCFWSWMCLRQRSLRWNSLMTKTKTPVHYTWRDSCGWTAFWKDLPRLKSGSPDPGQ